MIETALRVESSGATDTGCLRDHNEDRFLDAPESGLWVVTDGMGGHEAGDYAAQMIVDCVASVGRPASIADLEARFMARLELAHEAIQRQGLRLGGATVGATLAALMIHRGRYAAVWSGDSRVYRLRGARFEQITTDHTEVQGLLASGALTPAQAAVWPRRNVLTRAIGVGERPMTEARQGDVVAGDVFLLCSDGLTEHVSDAEMAALIADHAPDAACRALIALTLERGAGDNVTVIVLRCRAAGPV